MDLNSFEWDVVKKKRSFGQASLSRLIWGAPLIGLSGWGCFELSVSQRLLNPQELMVLLVVIEVVAIAVINLVLQVVYNAMPPKLIHFKISELGIVRDKKKIAINSLDSGLLDGYLKPYTLAYQDWKKPRPETGELLRLTLASNQGKMEVLFPEEYLRQRFIRALEGYLHPEQLVTPS